MQNTSEVTMILNDSYRLYYYADALLGGYFITDLLSNPITKTSDAVHLIEEVNKLSKVKPVLFRTLDLSWIQHHSELYMTLDGNPVYKFKPKD